MTIDHHNPEVLTTVADDVEAAVITAALSARGIKATATGGFTAGFRTEVPGHIDVIVRHEDLARAKQVLSEIEQEQSHVDWSKVDVGDPEDN
ncbi:hypothetical protein Pla52o_40890 [Novipirellula galeiformis]|uniref:Uncharacterized protein n=1 Tax=Novipirellula galeiformis TaxID=2528004 RepID=A0A5C6CAY0_9BACT|nr:DUF2007 domain-containing protein [Novipirellula galeiformis]TWU21057.1 hypothetical protein Pla52o_40890 [Novipirellula galeiformis]